MSETVTTTETKLTSNDVRQTHAALARTKPWSGQRGYVLADVDRLVWAIVNELEKRELDDARAAGPVPAVVDGTWALPPTSPPVQDRDDGTTNGSHRAAGDPGAVLSLAVATGRDHVEKAKVEAARIIEAAEVEADRIRTRAVTDTEADRVRRITRLDAFEAAQRTAWQTELRKRAAELERIAGTLDESIYEQAVTFQGGYDPRGEYPDEEDPR